MPTVPSVPGIDRTHAIVAPAPAAGAAPEPLRPARAAAVGGRPGRVAGHAARRAAALLCALALAGCLSSGDDCDGGISGTGCGVADADADADNAGVAAPDASSADTVFEGDVAAETTPSRAFENQTATLDGDAVGLRAVNLSSRAVDLIAGGAVRTDALEPGAQGPIVSLASLDAAARRLEIVDDATDETLAGFDATLAPRSLTTLVAFDAPDGTVRVEPLVTRTSVDDAAVALVRVVYATPPPDAGRNVATLVLRPSGAAPGGAAVDFVSEGPMSVASAYESVAAGDYVLAVRGDASAELPVSFDGGSVYTLFLGADGRFVRLVDGDARSGGREGGNGGAGRRTR